MKRKKNKIIIYLLIINIIVLSILFIIFKDDEVKDYNVYFRQLQGVWGYKDNILEIKDLNSEHIFSEGKYNTEEKKIGTIKKIEEITHSKYEIEIIIKDTQEEEQKNKDNYKIEYIIVEKNNKKNLVIYNNNEYKYVTNDPTNEEMIKSFFNK